MRRVLAILMVFALALAACGGSDSVEAGDVAAVQADDASEDSSQADEPAPEPEETQPAAADPEPEPTEPEPEPAQEPEPVEETEDTVTDTSSDDTSGDTISVNSIDDIPQVCQDLMEDFLKEIEPIVSPIDWQSASMADFEVILEDFERIATDFETETDAVPECDDLDLDDDENFDLIVEFAEDKAPGTVGFMSFIGEFAAAANPGAAPAGGGFDDCDAALSWLMGLVGEYDAMAQVPVSEITRMAELGTVLMTCTPEQLAYLETAEVEDFMSGL